LNIRRVALAKSLTVLVVLAAALATSLGVSLARPAEAAFPGEDGKISFARSGDIYLAEADGTNAQNITADYGEQANPAVSPDGSRIAYEYGYGIWVMNADGSARREITDGSAGTDKDPTWSPDGTRIAFVRDGDIWSMNAAGSSQKNLTNTPDNQEFDPAFSPKSDRIAYTRTGCQVPNGGGTCVYAMNGDGSSQADLGAEDLVPGCPDNASRDFDTVGRAPAWSPDGTKIAFSGPTNCPHTLGVDIWLMNADGSGKRNLVGDNGTKDTAPAFSPDGQEIVFESDRDSNWPELYAMSSLDGSALRRLTANSTWDNDAEWQPIPGCTISGTGTITGTPGDDVICGSAGVDAINGGGGGDIILAGGGADALVGGPGNDQLNGGPGADVASFAGSTAVNASLTTGFAAVGTGEADALSTIENLNGSSANDTLTGSTPAANTLKGLGGADVLQVKDGRNNDKVDGGTGRDACRRDAGDVTRGCP
jgi:hypothetical protein